MVGEFTIVPADGHRACGSCAKAKLKCTPHPNGGPKCDRCSRLGKDCVEREAKKRKKSTVPRNRALEQRLDNIVSLLAARDSQPHRNGESPEVTTHNSPQNTIPGPWNRQYPYPHEENSSSFVQLWPPLPQVEAEEMLSDFRQNFAAFVPCVMIPYDLSAKDLYGHKPFLFSSIMATTSYGQPDRQAAWLRILKLHLGDKVIASGEKNLDLLQGTLVLASWYHAGINGMSQPSNLLHIAMCIIDDLRLKVAPNQCDVKEFVRSPSEQTAFPEGEPIRSTEELRVLAGAYYLTTVTSCCLRKLDPMAFTPYTIRCMGELAEMRQCYGDLQLSYIVRLQHILDMTFGHRPFETGGGSFMFVRTVQKEIRKYERELPEELRNDKVLRIHTCAMEIRLLETILVDLPRERAGNAAQRMDFLNDQLTAIKSLFETLLSMSIQNWYTLPWGIWAMNGQALVASLKMIFRETDEWVLRHIFTELQLLDTFDRFLQVACEGLRRVNVPEDGAHGGQKHFFFLWQRRMGLLKGAIVSRFGSLATGTESPRPSAATAASTRANTVGDDMSLGVGATELVGQSTPRPEGLGELAPPHPTQQNVLMETLDWADVPDFIATMDAADNSFWQLCNGFYPSSFTQT